MGGSQSSRLSRGISERSKGRKYSLESPSSIIHLFFFLHTFISRPSLHPSSISKLKRAFQRQHFQLGTLIWQTSLINRSRVCKTFCPHGWIYQYVNGCKEKDSKRAFYPCIYRWPGFASSDRDTPKPWRRSRHIGTHYPPCTGFPQLLGSLCVDRSDCPFHVCTVAICIIFFPCRHDATAPRRQSRCR